MRALVIDDERLVLDSLGAWLHAALPELSLDATPDATTALRLAGSVEYELVLLDWHLVDGAGNDLDGREMVRALRSQGCRAPILVVSGDDSANWHALVLELGLAGMVPKTASGETLVDAIQVATRGGIYLPRPLTQQRTNPRYRVPAEPPKVVDPKERFPELTERQVDVFRVMLRGRGDKQIARELGISETTVKTHVRNILGVVGVHRRGEAIFEITGRGSGPAGGG